MDRKRLKEYRHFLKDSVRRTIDFTQTDQHRGIHPPPIQKPYAHDKHRIDLVPPGRWKMISPLDIVTAVMNRKSHRKFLQVPLTIDELSFLLWATQGIRKQVDAGSAFRTVPSAGCRHALETYLCILNVSGVEGGIYRYLPVENQLLFERKEGDLASTLVEGTLHQGFIGRAPVAFIWTAIPYRMEWRYDIAAHKVLAIDAGHVCQNLYLACQAVGAGTCAIAAYNQELMDRFLGVDGVEEFTVYLAPVGKVP